MTRIPVHIKQSPSKELVPYNTAQAAGGIISADEVDLFDAPDGQQWEIFAERNNAGFMLFCTPLAAKR